MMMLISVYFCFALADVSIYICCWLCYIIYFDQAGLTLIQIYHIYVFSASYDLDLDVLLFCPGYMLVMSELLVLIYHINVFSDLDVLLFCTGYIVDAIGA